MTSFKTRQIRKNPPLKPLKHVLSFIKWLALFLGRKILKPLGRAVIGLYRGRSVVVGTTMVLVSIVVVFSITRVLLGFIWDFDLKSLLFVAGQELKHDESGRTNIVLLGDGGFERDGAGLIDTIIVASIDFENYQVSMLSIPRDLFLHTEGYGSGKINQFYVTNTQTLGDPEGFEVYRTLLSNILNLDIHYYIRVDFGGFVEVVDAMGGVNDNVHASIEDPYYPNDTDTGYKTFRIAAGPKN
ncbi:LCP family protein [Candidatus Peregrinibacteria bacterium]|nr:MAG: LCP family protein [Candidatus Peregrinibacteria bacterium]